MATITARFRLVTEGNTPTDLGWYYGYLNDQQCAIEEFGPYPTKLDAGVAEWEYRPDRLGREFDVTCIEYRGIEQ